VQEGKIKPFVKCKKAAELLQAWRSQDLKNHTEKQVDFLEIAYGFFMVSHEMTQFPTLSLSLVSLGSSCGTLTHLPAIEEQTRRLEGTVLLSLEQTTGAFEQNDRECAEFLSEE